MKQLVFIAAFLLSVLDCSAQIATNLGSCAVQVTAVCLRTATCNKGNSCGPVIITPGNSAPVPCSCAPGEVEAYTVSWDSPCTGVSVDIGRPGNPCPTWPASAVLGACGNCTPANVYFIGGGPDIEIK